MITTIEERLRKLGIDLPPPAAPAANYAPFLISGSQLFISGQLPMGPNGVEIQGKLGDVISIDTGQLAAQLCAINILAQARAALDGNLNRLRACLRLGVFVNATSDFTDHPRVANGASDLIAAALAEKGVHTRFAMGAASLPFNAAVEVDALFEFA